MKFDVPFSRVVRFVDDGNVVCCCKLYRGRVIFPQSYS